MLTKHIQAYGVLIERLGFRLGCVELFRYEGQVPCAHHWLRSSQRYLGRSSDGIRILTGAIRGAEA